MTTQPIGQGLQDYTKGSYPDIACLMGEYAVVERLDVHQHFSACCDLYESLPPETFTYLSWEPFANRSQIENVIQQMCQSIDPYYLVIKDRHTQQLLGTVALMRITPQHRVIEMGWVVYSPALQRSRIATEAQFLLARYVFEELHYRRYEWKCDSLNAPSRRAAERIGFTYEGTFRQAIVYKDRNRDTAWFSMLDKEWETKRLAFERWLSTDNFDEHGQQIKGLTECRDNE